MTKVLHLDRRHATKSFAGPRREPGLSLSALDGCLRLGADRPPQFAQPLALLLNTVLEIADARDQGAGQRRLIEMMVQDGFAHLGRALGDRVQLPRTRLHLCLKVFEMGLDARLSREGDWRPASRVVRTHGLTIARRTRGVRLSADVF